MPEPAPSSVQSIYEAVNLFEYVGMPERKLARRTRREYRKDLEDLIEYLESQKVFAIQAVNLAHLQGFQAALTKAGCKQSTVRRKSFAVKVFCRFLATYGVTSDDVASELIPPPPSGVEPRFLTKQEYKDLLSVCSGSSRDTAMMQLFLQTGMRLSELAGLRLPDVNLPRSGETAAVRIQRRTGTLDTIPLNEPAAAALRRWLDERSQGNSDALFLSRHRKPLSKRSVQFLITEYLNKAQITGASVHTLRHTMATHHAAQGTDAKVIQETLGLSSLSQAEKYLEAAKRAQRSALEDHAL